MQYIIYILALPFLYINYRIILSDNKDKMIPNKFLGYLLILLPFWYILLFTYSPSINYWWFILQIVLASVISFILYYHWIWSAWDAKYLLILSLFIPSKTILAFIGNIAILTIIYLISSYLLFYGRLLFQTKKYRESVLYHAIRSKKESFIFLLNVPWTNKREMKNIIYRLTKFVVLFLVLFVGMRLLRQYLIKDIRNTELIINLYKIYPIYVFLAIWGVLIGLFLFLRKWALKIKSMLTHLISKKIWQIDIDLILISILFICLIGFIYYEFMVDPVGIIHKLFLIFTIYLWLFFIGKLLHFSYILTFQLWEQLEISIEDLQIGDIVDKEFLIKLFGAQSCLWYQIDNGILSPSPEKYFREIENPINKETYETIKLSYQTVKSYHEENKTPWFQVITTIKILKTFAFWIYIFIGFLITFFIGEMPLHFLLKQGIVIFHMF